MEKQNEGIWDLAETGDPGRHERLVTVEDLGEEKAFITRKTRRFIFYTQNHQKWTREVASYPEKLCFETIGNFINHSTNPIESRIFVEYV